MSDGTNVKLTFDNLLPNREGLGNMSYYNGYQGFDFTDMELMTRNWVKHAEPSGSGFANVLHGEAEIYTHGSGYNFNATYGWITSATPDETFNLKSGIFAAGDSSFLLVGIYSFDASGNMVGQLNLDLNDTATSIDFANYGNAFKKISTVEFVGYARGYVDIIAMDNLTAHWNGPIPHGGGTSSVPDLPVHRHHPHIAHALSPGANQAHDGHVASDVAATNSHHGELMSLAAALGHADPGGGLTAQFVLPHCDHFGT